MLLSQKSEVLHEPAAIAGDVLDERPDKRRKSDTSHQPPIAASLWAAVHPDILDIVLPQTAAPELCPAAIPESEPPERLAAQRSQGLEKYEICHVLLPEASTDKIRCYLRPWLRNYLSHLCHLGHQSGNKCHLLALKLCLSSDNLHHLPSVLRDTLNKVSKPSC
ncbi:hypothetical protein PR202_gb12992 [Eleusine coracana subsp. coracana]|uniref:Uncharacterized protein n=1 Tax=Eleusine coracana subsp. coracana TaxID=191504 RepID=A0AAV5EPB1_ELECO|nr:hypothetical protein PR202_gb12992 [Eleusine coracana subsp. coracana]